jgi:hypothetical protein
MDEFAPTSVVTSDPVEPAAPSAAPAIPPLGVSGLIVAKADLLAALRLYVPQLVDITPLDAARFELALIAPPAQNAGAM